MKRSYKKTVIWLVLILIDCGIVIGISEVWTRIFIPVRNTCWKIDRKIGAMYCPNQRTYGYVEKGYSNIFITNSYGFHDIGRKIEKTKNTFRIHIYGDSMIGGTGVQIEETIPAVVERELNKKGLPIRFEVMNMAAGDESTSSQLLTYQEIGTKFSPDLVILYFMDDFPENIIETHGKYHIPYHHLNENGKLEYIPPLPKDTTTLWEQFKRSCLLYRLLANKLLESELYFEMTEYLKTVKYYLYPNRDAAEKKSDLQKFRREMLLSKAWPLTLRLIKHFHDICLENGTNFILADGREIGENTVGIKYSNEDFKNELEKMGIAYVPVYKMDSPLRESDQYSRFVFKDNHLNALGNTIVGSFLSKEVMKYIIGNDLEKKILSAKKQTAINVGGDKSNDEKRN